MPSCQLTSFRGAVHILCQPTGNRTSRAAAEKYLDSLKLTEEGWHTLLTVISADTWNNWTPEERLVAASQLFSASCKGKSLTGESLSKICPRLATSLRAAHETHDLSTAGYISRTLIAILIRSPEVNEIDLISILFQLVSGGTGGGNADGDTLNDLLLRLLSCVPEVVTLSSLSMHPIRRQSIIAALTTDLLLNNSTNNNNGSSNSFSAVSSLASLVTSPLQAHLQASESTQIAALNVIYSWSVYLGCVPPIGLTENNIEYIHLLAAQVGGGGRGGCGGRGNEPVQTYYVQEGGGIAATAVETIAALYSTCSNPVEKQEREKKLEQRNGKAAGAAAAALLPLLLNCLPELLAAFSNTITAASSSSSSSDHQDGGEAEEALAAAVTILGAATAAAASAPPNTIASEATSTFLAQSLLSLLRHPDSDTRIATLAIFDTWLSTPLEQHSRESNFTKEEKAQLFCFPSVEALTALLQQLVSCVNLHGLFTSALTADARDLPEEAQMMRRETTDSIKLVVAALGPLYAAKLLVQLSEKAHSQGDMLQLEACLYVANLIPKSSFLGGNRNVTEESELGKTAENGGLASGYQFMATSKDQNYDIIENLVRLGTASILPTAPKLAGTALTLLGGLGPLLGEIFLVEELTGTDSLVCPPPGNAGNSNGVCWTAFTQAFTIIISTILNSETSDPKLARNAATTVFRLASVPSLAKHIAPHLPAAIEALYHWYINNKASLQGGLGAAAPAAPPPPNVLLNQSQISEKYPNDITTSEFVLKSLCLLGGSQAHQFLLVEHARRAEEALASVNDFLPAVVTLHLKSLAIILEIAKQQQIRHLNGSRGRGEGGGGGSELGEAGIQLGQLLLHAATTTTAAAAAAISTRPSISTTISNNPSKEQVPGTIEGGDVQNLSSALLDCSGSLAAVCPNTMDVCIQIVDILAVLDLASALQALSIIISDGFSLLPSSTYFQNGVSIEEQEKAQLGGTRNVRNIEFGQAVAQVAVTIAEKVFQACANPSQNQSSDAAFVALLQFLKVFLMQQWPPGAFPSSFSSLENVVLASLSAASQSWNRDICEASLGLASELLKAISISNDSHAGTSTATTATTVLSFLLAASCGGQPPYMLPSIADVVYSTWVHTSKHSSSRKHSDGSAENQETFFFEIFTGAMAAPMQLPGGAAAPWSAWTQDISSKYLNDLFSEASRKDDKRFKRVFKALCGGKKKGSEAREPPARQF